MIYYAKGSLLVRELKFEDISAIVEEEIRQGWHSTPDKYLQRLKDNEAGKSTALVAVYEGIPVGYVNVYWNKEWPEIVDFGVVERVQRQGIGTVLMDIAERLAFEKGDIVTLGVGLHAGYGIAQRMYAKRGYIPDGKGAYYDESVCTPYSSYCLDDSLLLKLWKKKKSVHAFEVKQADKACFAYLWDRQIARHGKQDSRWISWKQEYAAIIEKGWGETWAVFADEQPIGEATLLFDPRCGAIAGRTCLADGKKVANFNALRVEPQWQGKGAATALAKVLEERAKALGYESLTIGAEAQESRNLAIYLHWGYTGFLMAEKEEGEDHPPVLYYAKKL